MAAAAHSHMATGASASSATGGAGGGGGAAPVRSIGASAAMAELVDGSDRTPPGAGTVAGSTATGGAGGAGGTDGGIGGIGGAGAIGTFTGGNVISAPPLAAQAAHGTNSGIGGNGGAGYLDAAPDARRSALLARTPGGIVGTATNRAVATGGSRRRRHQRRHKAVTASFGELEAGQGSTVYGNSTGGAGGTGDGVWQPSAVNGGSSDIQGGKVTDVSGPLAPSRRRTGGTAQRYVGRRRRRHRHRRWRSGGNGGKASLAAGGADS